MSATPILFAAGPRGVTLSVPDGVQLQTIGKPIDPAPARSEAEQRAIVQAALEAPEYGPPLSKLAAIKRRAVILAGDLSRPAPYDIVLPAIVEILVKAGIRPSRIAFVACPGGGGPLLGRNAIHRYGEEICGEHEVVAWPAEGTPGEFYNTADLRIAVASRMGLVRFESFMRVHGAEIGIDLTLGKKVGIDIESVRVYGPLPDKNHEPHPSIEPGEANVWITSSGGYPWEETLEEALLSFRFATALAPNPVLEEMAKATGMPVELLRNTMAETQHHNMLVIPSANFSTVSTTSAVLVFSGAEGLGSARFAHDIWALIEQAEEVLAAGRALNFSQKPGAPYDPASTLAECLSRYKNTVLFAPEFLAHPEGDDLADRLAAAPHVAERLALCGQEQELWTALALLHGPAYSLAAQPLGWRAY